MPEIMNRILRNLIPVCLILFFSSGLTSAQTIFSAEDLLKIENCKILQISSAGDKIIYAKYTQRTPNKPAGNAHVNYFSLNLKNGDSSPLFKKDFKASAPLLSPDGKVIAFLLQEKDKPKQIWIQSSSQEAPIKITNSESAISGFKWNPDGKGITYLASEPKTDREKELKKRGYDFIFFEENIKNTNLYSIRLDKSYKPSDLRQITTDMNIWDFEFNSKGSQIAYSASEKKLIDQMYMFKKIHVYDLEKNKLLTVLNNQGKLGNYAFSPDGSKIAYTSALNINDHAVSQAFVYDISTKSLKNLNPKNFKGHVSWLTWENNAEITYFSSEGVYPKLSTVSISGGERSIILDSENSGVIFHSPLFSSHSDQFIFVGSSPKDPSNIYTWNAKDGISKLTDLNPILKTKKMGSQEVFSYAASDGQTIEGILIKPIDFQKDKKYPLLVFVHGGPESHHSNGWLTHYSIPGQVMAGKGYLIAYINYRASTGYGTDFALEGLNDPAGREFDDLADGIEYLIENKNADADRVGMAGGSYGGYASAWFATYYTKHVKAVSMFVGISNVISKRGTTDIPYEELYVHSGKPLEEQWQMNLERSPIYWAHQSKTATLIIGGAADTRVNPTQSMELFRRMKMNDHPAVRLVQYPGEGHGNKKQVNRMDVLYRQMAWFDWYVKDLKPLNGSMPPLDISDSYGLDWEF